MVELDYEIEEHLDTEEMRVCYRIFKGLGLGMAPRDLATSKTFDTLDEAKGGVRLLRKYKNRFFHYVED